MTIQYKAANRITGNSTDNLVTPTFEDFFDTDLWDYTNSGTSWVYQGSGVNNQFFFVPNSASDDRATYDLTSVSDTTWTLRFKITWTSFENNTSGTIKRDFIGLFSSTSTMTTAQDGIFFDFGSNSSVRTLKLGATDGATPNTNTGDNFVLTGEPRTLYVELKRLSATVAECTLYNDQDYSQPIETKQKDIASTIKGLRYIQHANRSGAGVNGDIRGTIDNIQFWDGVTQPVTTSEDFSTYDTPITDPTTLILDDDFASDNWIDQDSTNGSRVTGGDLVLDLPADSTKKGTHYDLGSGVADTKWVCILENMQFTTFGTANATVFWFGLSSADSSLTRTSTARDFLGFHALMDGTNEEFALDLKDSASLTGSLGQALNWNNSDRYDVVLIRDGDNFTIEAYVNNPTRTGTPNATDTTTGANALAGLRYLVFHNTDDQTIGSSNIDGTVQKISFYNGVTQTVSPVLETADVDDDLTVDNGWQSVETNIEYDAVLDAIDCHFVRDGTSDYTYIDVQDADWLNGVNLSDTKFEVRFSWTVDASSLTASTTSSVVSLQSVVQMDYGTTNRDAFGYEQLWDNGSATTRINTLNGQDYDDAVSSIFTTSMTDLTTYYVSMRRDGDDFTLSFYSDPNYTNLIESQTRTTSGIVDLRYFAIFNNNGGSNSTTADTTLDDIKIWNGQFAPVVDNTWVSNDENQNFIDIANKNMSIDMIGDSSEDDIVYDLEQILGTGNRADKYSWCVRMRMNFSTIVDGVGWGRFHIGLSDKDETAGVETNQMFLGVKINPDLDTFLGEEANNQQLNIAQDGTGNVTWATSTDYYLEFKRTSISTYEVNLFSNSDYSTLIDSAGGTCASAIDDLRYLVFRNAGEAVGGVGQTTGIIDEISFWNGQRDLLSDTDSKPYEVPTFSTFDETDTAERKTYYGNKNYVNLGTRFDSYYQHRSPFTILQKQHFWEFFSGKGGTNVPSSIWTFTNYAGTNTGAMADSIDGGFTLTSGATSGDNCGIHFNDKHQYNEDGSRYLGIMSQGSTTNQINMLGLVNGQSGGIHNDISYVGFWASIDSTYYTIRTYDGTTASNTITTFTADTNWHLHDVTLSSSNNVYSIDGSLQVTKTTNLPLDKLQPFIRTNTETTGSKNASFRYYEVFNT